MRSPFNFLVILCLCICIQHHITNGFVRIRLKRIGNSFKKIGNAFEKFGNILTKGCCGLHPIVCEQQKEFGRRQRDIKSKSAEIDRDWILVKKVLGYIKNSNGYNNEIYQNIRRITLVSKTTIVILDPKIIIKMNNVSSEIQEGIVQKNKTVLTFGIDQITDEYDKTKKESETQILDATGIGGFQMTAGYIKMTGSMFRMMKLDSVANFMEKDVAQFLDKAKGLVSKLFGFDYLEKLAKTNKILSVVLDVLKFYNNYLSFAGGMFKLMELTEKFIGWIVDLATCNKQKSDIDKNIKLLRKDHAKVNENLINLRKYKITVTTNWAKVREQTISDAVFTQLVTIEDIAKRAGSGSSKSFLAAKTIAAYRANSRTSTPENLIKLQKELAKSLGDITYTSECHNKRLAMFQAVYRGCKLGKDSFEVLYDRAVVDFKPNVGNCRSDSGIPYTTRFDVKKFVTMKADKERFEINCLLNSGLKRALTCSDIHSGYTATQVAAKLHIPLPEVQSMGQSCQSPNLSPKETVEMCTMSKFISLEKIYLAFPDVNNEMISNAFIKCT